LQTTHVGAIFVMTGRCIEVDGISSCHPEQRAASMSNGHTFKHDENNSSSSEIGLQEDCVETSAAVVPIAKGSIASKNIRGCALVFTPASPLCQQAETQRQTILWQ
jgi:hypothetical protein